jgi:hypothetical protein
MIKPNIQIWPIERLKPYEKNVKIHDDAQVKAIAESIRRFGWDQPISVDKDGTIIKGHGRRLASLHLGLTEVPVWVRDDLTEAEVRASRLVDNQVAKGEIDTNMFRLELADLNYELSSFFSAKELDFAVADLGEINTDAFVDDVNAAIDEQAEQTREKATAAVAKPVPLHKVLGFKEIPGEQQLVVTRAMAEIERRTAKKGVDAFVAFCHALWAAPTSQGA